MNAPTGPLPLHPSAGDHPLAAVLSDARKLFLSGAFEDADALLVGFSGAVAGAAEVFVHGRRSREPAASIIIVSHRKGGRAEAALDAIARECRPTREWEIILVGNGDKTLLEVGRTVFSGFLGITPPFVLGASAARNLGAWHARGDTVIFLDDDGVIEPGGLRALLACLDETGATAARGKVLPLHGSRAPHYDLGDGRMPAFIDCEGVSAWRQQPFLDAGGFHPLLDAHEGIDLCGRLWRRFGPLAFVYEPSAVLRHDYAATPARAREKANRRGINKAYISRGEASALGVHRKVQAIARNAREFYIATAGLRSPVPAGGPPVSIITTARNVGDFIEEYLACWKRQTLQDFQLVFVDDGSSDSTVEMMRKLWDGDERLTLIEQAPLGRGAALNRAFAAARHEICLIADADDLSIPSRIARTVGFFVSRPQDDFMSFLAFNELNLFRIGPPLSPFVTDMDVRSLFHMPVSFPAFACRKQKFTEPFDETLPGGVDCDWLHRNMEAAGVKGQLVQYPAVYYGRHPGQITRHHNDIQWQMRERLLHYAFGRVLGTLGESDKFFIDLIVDVKKASADERRKLGIWTMNLIARNDLVRAYAPETFRRVMMEALQSVRQLPTPREKLESFRLEAERHIEAGDYKRARRALRQALRIGNDREVRSRMIAASRFWFLRVFARSRPFTPD